MVQRYIADCEGSDADGYESVQRSADGDFVTYKDYAELEKQRDVLVAENVWLKSQAVYLFNCGYGHGHEGTVEGCYVDIHRGDIRTYNEDIVTEIIEEETPATDDANRELMARGVDALAEHLSGMNIHASETSVKEFAQQLREGGVRMETYSRCRLGMSELLKAHG